MARHLTPAEADDDRGSLVLATLLIMLGTMLAALLVPIVVTQATTTRFDTRRGHALDGAQAGVDVLLGRIRAAADTNGAGLLAKLPCTASGPVTGAVSTAGSQRYEANVYYFSSDPRGHEDWLNDTTKQLVCNSNGLPRTPGYAVIVARGTDSATGSFSSVPTRTVEATYVFKTKNTNVQGGLIHSYGSNPDLCLDAGSSSPAIGTIVTFQPCAAGTAQQLWSFNTDLTISLAGSADTTNNDYGVCLDALDTHTAGEPITIQSCSSTTLRHQQWSFNGNNNFIATQPGGKQEPSTGAASCWNPQSANTVGASLILGSCGGRDTSHGFQPDPAVGAGNADATQQFLVNYNQFGRCLDVTNQWIPQHDDTKFLIAFPCKVSPDTSSQPTNQQWNIPAIASGAKSAKGVITSVQDSSYCLTSPLSQTAGGYPYLDKCVSPTPTNQTWTVTGDTGEYTTSYRISDSTTVTSSDIGYCLQPTDPTLTPPDLFGSAQVSKVIVTSCSGTTLQKWNAPPGVVPIPVKDYHEK